METTFIYALCEPGTRTVRYIGKANKPRNRFTQHLRDSSKARTHLGNWLRSLLATGDMPNLVVLREIPVDQWEIAEERYIRLARGLGIKLVNGTDGGEGNHNLPEESRSRISAAHLGSKRTPETRKKMSEAQLGSRNHFFGRTHSEESLRKMRSIKLGKRPSLESREKRSRALKGRVFSTEHREKLRLAALRRYSKT